MRVVLAVARSKFCHRQYFSNRVYLHVVLSAATKAFSNILINHCRAANCYDFGVAATLFNPDYAATLVTSMLRL